jgi:integrase
VSKPVSGRAVKAKIAGDVVASQFLMLSLPLKRSVTRVNPLTSRQLNRACHVAARLAEIDKPVSVHSLRHSFADRALRRIGLCSPFSS